MICLQLMVPGNYSEPISEMYCHNNNNEFFLGGIFLAQFNLNGCNSCLNKQILNDNTCLLPLRSLQVDYFKIHDHNYISHN